MEKLDLTVFEKSQLIDNYKSELRKLEFQIEAARAAIALLETGAAATAPQVSIIETEQSAVSSAEEKVPQKRGPKAKEKVAEPVLAKVIPEPATEVETPAAVKGKPGKKTGTKKTAAPQEAPSAAVAVAEASTESTAPAPKKGKGKSKLSKATASTAQVEDALAPLGKPEKVKKEKKEKPKVAKAPKENKTEAEGDRKKPGPKATMSFWDEFILEKLRAMGDGSLSSSELLEAMKSERDAKDLQLGNTQLAQLLNRSLQKLVHKMKLVASQQLAGRNFAYWAK
jgi:hypothetical protein